MSDCTTPNEPLPNPPGATHEQRKCAIAKYADYLDAWYACVPSNCKCKEDAWQLYVILHGQCFST